MLGEIRAASAQSHHSAKAISERKPRILGEIGAASSQSRHSVKAISERKALGCWGKSGRRRVRATILRRRSASEKPWDAGGNQGGVESEPPFCEGNHERKPGMLGEIGASSSQSRHSVKTVGERKPGMLGEIGASSSQSRHSVKTVGERKPRMVGEIGAGLRK